ncbi:MAG: uroporphyrinogen decarboxylase family protein, partial [Clostridia bacterium]|nr:uroporphyrinogen decarboxylase family protein [Clostridia bacterium]
SSLMDKYGDRISSLKRMYPDDVISINITIGYWDSEYGDQDYRFAMRRSERAEGNAADNNPIIRDWSDLPGFLNEFPRMDKDEPFNRIRKLRRENPDAYILVGFGHYFFQRLASLRGAQNFLMDFYDYPDKLEVVLEKLFELYDAWAHLAAEAGADGITGSDDLGTQRGLFVSPELLRKFIFPYYKKLSEVFIREGLDFWLHTCGNVTSIMEDIIESGVRVLHPLQAGTMDDDYISREYAGRICFNVGMDVQGLIPNGTPDEVTEGVRKRAKVYYNDFGGVVYSAGNVILTGTPIENIEAYAESLHEFCQSKVR